MANGVIVYSARVVTDLVDLKALLEDENIECFIRNERVSMLAGEIPQMDVWPQLVVVDPVMAEKAKKLIEDWKRKIDEARESGVVWTCHSCGEILEAQFNECWKCGDSKK